jgi:penicillin amidase
VNIYLKIRGDRVILAEEKVLLPDGRYETVQTRETHIGPILFEEGEATAVAQTPSGLALQWTGLIPSNELKSFLTLNRAQKSIRLPRCIEGIRRTRAEFCLCRPERDYHLSACRLFPDRRNRDGRLVSEASKSSDVWQGFLSPEENPAIENVRDFVVTANQAPFNGTRQSDYGWFLATPYRAMQIERLISAKLKGTKRKGKLTPRISLKFRRTPGAFYLWHLKDLVLKESKLHH